MKRKNLSIILIAILLFTNIFTIHKLIVTEKIVRNNKSSKQIIKYYTFKGKTNNLKVSNIQILFNTTKLKIGGGSFSCSKPIKGIVNFDYKLYARSIYGSSEEISLISGGASFNTSETLSKESICSVAGGKDTLINYSRPSEYNFYFKLTYKLSDNSSHYEVVPLQLKELDLSFFNKNTDKSQNEVL